MNSELPAGRHTQLISVRTPKPEEPTNVKEIRGEYNSVLSLYDSTSSRKQKIDEEIVQLEKHLSPETDYDSMEGSGDAFSESEYVDEEGKI